MIWLQFLLPLSVKRKEISNKLWLLLILLSLSLSHSHSLCPYLYLYFYICRSSMSNAYLCLLYLPSSNETIVSNWKHSQLRFWETNGLELSLQQPSSWRELVLQFDVHWDISQSCQWFLFQCSHHFPHFCSAFLNIGASLKTDISN
jgi:hypothetical protein